MVYADHNGTSPLLPEIRDFLTKRLQTKLFANPNSIHSLGHQVQKRIELCREKMAEILGAHPAQIIFNSGSSEGISHVIHHCLLAAGKKKIVFVSAIEHAAVLNTLIFHQKNSGFDVRTIPVLKNGVVDLNWLETQLAKLSDQTALVTVIAANNETGVMQPYFEIQKICSELKVSFFSDTTQILGKEDFNFADSNLDFAILSGHKIGALPGIGALLVKDPTTLHPLIWGGGQEQNLRGGTQNYLGIETLCLALESFQAKKTKTRELKKAKLEFESGLKKKFPQVFIFGSEVDRLAGTSLIGYAGLHGQGLQIELESQDIFVTTSSACSDNEPSTSKVLKAMGTDDQLGRSVVRISLSIHQELSDYKKILNALTEAYRKVSKIEFNHAL
jgi:cysteine desulfurase